MTPDERRRLFDYRKRREAFYGQYAKHWPGTLLDAFDILEPFPVDSAELREVRRAARFVAGIYSDLMTLLQVVDNDTLTGLGVPPDAAQLSRVGISSLDAPVVGRIDFAKAPDGFKLLDFNTDAPGLMVECFSMNDYACRDAGLPSANRFEERRFFAGLFSAIKSRLERVGKATPENANVVVCAVSEYTRDKDMAQYIARQVDASSGLRIAFAPVESLRADQNGIYCDRGRRVDVLLLMHSFRYFCRECVRSADGDGFLDEAALSELVRDGKLVVINSPASHLLHSKAMQAAIWALAEAECYFDKRKRDEIRKVFLPTYVHSYPGNERYVRKPFFGSNGDAITVVDPDLGPIAESRTVIHINEPMVYQKFVELPSLDLLTEHGVLLLQSVISVFVVNGEPIGVTMRAGHGITDNSWWFVPLYLKGNRKSVGEGRWVTRLRR